MKKVLALLLTLAMVFSLASCGSTAAGESTDSASTAVSAVESTEEAPEEAAPAEAEEVPAEEEAAPAEAEEAPVEAEEASIEEATAEEPSVQEEAAPEEPLWEEVTDDRVVTVTDMSGDEVTIEGKVERIVNLWPAGTSSFFVMGAGELVDGLAVNNAGTVNSWAKLFYPAAGDIAAMGGTTPSIEELLALDPDLVIVHPMTVSSGFAQEIRDAGIPAIDINFSTYDTMITSYTMLGEVLGGEYQYKLNSWCEMVAEKQAEIEEITADISEEDAPVVYYIAGQSDSLTTTMGSNSICADWTHLAGGIYATDLLEDTTVTEITAEEIFAIDPDIIIVGGNYQHVLVDELQNTDGWKDLSAVVNGKVYTNPYGAFAWDRFGLESYFQLDYALYCINPELAADAGIDRDSILQEVYDFYVFMNGTELTDDELNNMFDGLEPDGSQLDPAAAGGGGGPAAGQSGTHG